MAYALFTAANGDTWITCDKDIIGYIKDRIAIENWKHERLVDRGEAEPITRAVWSNEWGHGNPDDYFYRYLKYEVCESTESIEKVTEEIVNKANSLQELVKFYIDNGSKLTVTLED